MKFMRSDRTAALFFCRRAATIIQTLCLLAAAPALLPVVPGTVFAAPAGAIDKEIADAKSLFKKGKLQDARDALARAQQQMESLSGTAASTYGSKVQKLSASIAAFEDSLVNVNIEILRRHGTDSAFQYMQDVVWAYGVSKEKLDQIENTILSEPPKVNEAKERDDVTYAVKLLESNQPIDPSLDPYIVKTAQMLLQSRSDSLKKAQAVAAPERQTTEAVQTPQEPVEKETQQVMKEEAPRIPAIKPVAEQPPKPAEAVVPPPEVSAVEPAAEQKPAPVVMAITPEPKRTSPAAKPKKPEEYTSPALLARAQASKDYLKKFKADQAVAQNDVVELYNMLESGQGPQAMLRFRDRRAFISKHVSPQVFNILELTLAQTIIDTQKGNAVSQTRPASSASPVEQTIRRLDGLMRQNKVEAAYKEFTREEQALRKYMPKKDFKLLKNMIEDAYTLRTGADIKKKK